MIFSQNTPPVVTLIATKPRLELLLTRSLPSINSQERRPDALVIVSDDRPFTAAEQYEITQRLGDTPLHFASNRGMPGAAGSWNTGIKLIEESWPEAYVALLDDDDSWDKDHLRECCTCAIENQMPDAVISGLRFQNGNLDVPTVPPIRLSPEDFLAGNPGWQGSNTFILLSTLVKAGRFTEGLSSCNDRDLAVRVLSIPKVTLGFTGKHTATWYLGTAPDQLSRKGSPAKLHGLSMFYQIHGRRMTPAIRKHFFERASAYFGFDETQITNAAAAR